MKNWFKSIMAPSLKTQLMLICQEMASDGVIYIVSDNMTFKMSYGKGVTVCVYTKDGLPTVIWGSHSGFNPLCKQNTFLISWFYEAVEQLHVAVRDWRRAKELDNMKLISELFEIWENRDKKVDLQNEN